jgi:ribosomal protein L37E
MCSAAASWGGRLADILVFCKRCGRQVSSSQVRDGLCLDCRLDDALEPLRREHARLWHKRERYLATGAGTTAIAAQVGRVEQRMADRIRELVAGDREVAERLKSELEKARQARYDIRRV